MVYCRFRLGKGVPLYDRLSPEPTRVLNPEEIRYMNRMLVRTVQAGTGRRAQVNGRSVAGKTGTTNDNRDAWFVGYAPGLSLAVWVGDDDNAPMKRITGGTLPADIFSDVMGVALETRPMAELPQIAKPDNILQQSSFNALLDRWENAASESGSASPNLP